MKPFGFMSFGRFIAFVLPGIVAARAAAYLVPSLQRAFTALEGASSEAAGPIFLVTVAALTIGLSLNAVRRGVVDSILDRIGTPRQRLDYSLLTEEKRARFGDVIEDVYRSYEFTANMALALFLLFGARAVWGPPGAAARPTLTIVVGGLGLLMLYFAWHELRESYRVMGKILGPQVPAPPGAGVPAGGRMVDEEVSLDLAPPEDLRAKSKDWPPE